MIIKNLRLEYDAIDPLHIMGMQPIWRIKQKKFSPGNWDLFSCKENLIVLSSRLATFPRMCKGFYNINCQYLFRVVWSSELWVANKTFHRKKKRILSCSVRTERKVISTFDIHSKWGRFPFKERASWSGMGSKIYEALSQKVVIWKQKWPTWCLSNPQFVKFWISWCLDILKWQITNFPLLTAFTDSVCLFVCLFVCVIDWLIDWLIDYF